MAGKLFFKNFKKHVDIISNTDIIRVSNKNKGRNQNMKNLFKEFEAAKKESDEIDARFEAEPENEEIEKEADAAYNKYFESFSKLVNAIVRFTNNEVDEKTARLLINTKYDAIKELLINC